MVGRGGKKNGQERGEVREQFREREIASRRCYLSLLPLSTMLSTGRMPGQGHLAHSHNWPGDSSAGLVPFICSNPSFQRERDSSYHLLTSMSPTKEGPLIHFHDKEFHHFAILFCVSFCLAMLRMELMASHKQGNYSTTELHPWSHFVS